MTHAEILELFDYDRWSAERQRDAIHALSAEDYARNLGSSLGGVRGTLVHIHAARMVWHARWAGEPRPTLPTEADLPNLADVETASEKLQTRIQELLAGLDDKKLMTPFPYLDREGNQRQFLLGQQMRHLVNHGTYHRGQLTTMLRQLGAEPVRSIDLTAYYESLAG